MELFTVLPLVLLALLEGEQIRPSALSDRIEAITGRRPTEGAFYAALRVGVKNGFITRHVVAMEGDWRSRASYQLTPKGREVIQEFAKTVAAFSTQR